MIIGLDYLRWVVIVIAIVLSTIVCRVVSVSTVCELSVIDNNKLYNYSLPTPTPEFPHGVLSEDGFYKVAVNETVVWFQLCDGMIFNHDPPKCIDCGDCGGPSHCGMDCSALMVNNIGGYYVCSTIGRASSTDIKIIDKKNPHVGVIVKMSSTGLKLNCSLSVSVICDSNGVQGPHSLEKLGTCDYATVLRHPSGCAKIVQFHGKGWGWVGTFLIIAFCLFGGYLLAGTVYRYFIIGIRGIEIIPNLDFWASLPHRTQSSFTSLVQKFRGPSQSNRSSYSPVNF
ncbi:hypothetical protein FH972_001271 [Carpinus fangiana]|uniref:Autophagy-related protein 27 n=1 Tax=Carpinus fangiana TaxID=176857 RepID=A0A5N6QB88_9ROSI|nr:hypothetical protein FH972_001271 [Carpinus fangiana]